MKIDCDIRLMGIHTLSPSTFPTICPETNRRYTAGFISKEITFPNMNTFGNRYLFGNVFFPLITLHILSTINLEMYVYKTKDAHSTSLTI